MPKLALNMIVKDNSEAQILVRCLNSVAKYVDGIYITVTNKPNDLIYQIIENYGGHSSFFKWNKSFEDARNFALDQVPEEYGYILWCDTDDVWVNPQKIKDVLQVMETQKITASFFDYNYEISKEGKVNIVHPRERIVKRGYYRWKGHLHETFIPIREVNNAYYKDIKVNHFPLPEDEDNKLYRNLEILEKTYKEEGEKHDPRTEYYLARNLFDINEFNRAYILFEDYLQHSGWDEERAQAHNYLGLIELFKKDYDGAITQFLNAVYEKPNVPTWYVNLSYTYALLKKFDEAIHYARLFVATPPPKTAMVTIPIDDELRYYESLYLIGIGTRKVPEAREAAQALVTRMPDNKFFQEKLDAVSRLEKLIDVTRGVEAIIEELDSQDETNKVATLLKGLPSTIEDNAYVEKMRLKHLPATVWPEKSIVYYAGLSFEEWTPDSLKSGLGGSETAIVNLSREWAKLGYNVTVYGNCGAKEGIYDGVEYKNYYRFNKYDTFDTLILWRAPWELDNNFKANKILLDLHDVPNSEEFTPERLKHVDKIMVKSKYHRDLLPNVPDEKFSILPNGVDKGLLNWNHARKDPFRLIYASSYDRGLEQMLATGWPLIKKAIPQATLDIYYGWNLFDAVHRNNPERMMWKKRILELMSQPGVTEHGRIGHSKLIEEKSKSTIHYYATTFEEIDCISVRESAAVGCVPIVSSYAALKEKSYAIKVKGDPTEESTQIAIAQEVIKHLKTPFTKEYIQQIKAIARKDNWSAIAKMWLEV